jgi:hypothetical protein
MERRNFIRNVLGYSGLGIVSLPMVSAWLSSCGSNNTSQGGSTPQPVSACPNGTSGDIPSDESHHITVPREDVVAGVPKDYHIQGQQNHDHVVSLTGDDFTQLRNGNQISPISSVTLGHQHTVLVRCV